MSHQTLKMSLGFIAVVALVLVLSGSAWANVVIDGSGHGASYDITTGAHTSPDIRNDSGVLNGTLNQSGDATVTGNVRLGYGQYSAEGETDIYNISGGTVNTSSFHLMSENQAFAAGCSGLLSISGGTFTTTDTNPQWGGQGAKATIAVSGTGTFNWDVTPGYNLWAQTDQHFEVTGGNATMNFGLNFYFDNGNRAIGGMKFTLTNSTGRISTIWVKGTSYDFDLSNVGNVGKIDVSEAEIGLVTINQKFDLLKIDQSRDIKVPVADGLITGANRLLKNDAERLAWSLSVVPNKDNLGYDVLELKALAPEPATMALLAIGGLGMLIRRRRRS